jgi:hypothetical protein
MVRPLGSSAGDIKMQCCILFRRKVSRLWQGPQSLSAVKCRLFAGPTTAFGKFMNFGANCSSGLDRRPTATRHEFVVGRLSKPAELQQKARLYYCIRCKWSFLVCGSEVAVLDEDGSPLGGDGSRRRFATFEEGPCPVLEAFVSAAVLSAGASQPHFRRECDEPVDLVRGDLHTRSGRRRPVLRVLAACLRI